MNAHALGRYAALSQEAGLVPIVEPEVLMDGGHTLERCYEVTEATLEAVFNELFSQRVVYEGMLLKPNMVVSGKDSPQQASPEEVAKATIRCFKGVVPAAVPGVIFLSGGQGDEEATANLSAMNALGAHPWELSFSYGRALQAPSLKAWGGQEANVQAGQQALAHRARMNGAARDGSYTAELEGARSRRARLPVLPAGEALELVQRVLRLDAAHRARARAHDDRLRSAPRRA